MVPYFNKVNLYGTGSTCICHLSRIKLSESEGKSGIRLLTLSQKVVTVAGLWIRIVFGKEKECNATGLMWYLWKIHKQPLQTNLIKTSRKYRGSFLIIWDDDRKSYAGMVARFFQSSIQTHPPHTVDLNFSWI